MDWWPALIAVALFGMVIYGWWRNWRPGATPVPHWERAVGATVTLVLATALFAWLVGYR